MKRGEMIQLGGRKLFAKLAQFRVVAHGGHRRTAGQNPDECRPDGKPLKKALVAKWS